MCSYRIIPLLFLAATVLSGCGGYAAIDGRDDSVLFPSLRVSYPLLDEFYQEGQSDHALEADWSRGSGSAHQALDAYDTISFAGATLQWPAVVRQDFTLDVAQIDARFRFPRAARVFVEFLAGYRYTDLDLRLRSADISAQRFLRDGGVIGGVGIGSRLTNSLMLNLRMVLDLNGKQDRKMQSLDLSASYWLSPRAAITAGLRRWQYERNMTGASDIDLLVWQGLSAGLAFSF